eukprot:gene9151-biopygen4574
MSGRLRLTLRRRSAPTVIPAWLFVIVAVDRVRNRGI